MTAQDEASSHRSDPPDLPWPASRRASHLAQRLSGAAAGARGGDSALHPRGRTHLAVVERRGGRRRWGVPWVDGTGDDLALVRLSRSAGLPPPLPDVHGIALRVEVDGRPGDVLLSGASWRPVARLLLLPSSRTSTWTSLVPSRTASGPLLIGARLLGAGGLPGSVAPDEATGIELELAVARPTGPWDAFARCRVLEPVDVRPAFDPTSHGLPGMTAPAALGVLRAAAYAGSRRARRAAPGSRAVLPASVIRRAP